MKFKDIIQLSHGQVLLLGNEAIARGALEGGLSLATAYPGTPSSEILESLISVRDTLNIHAFWSINEKVAYEVAYAASLSGLKSLVAMKHVGLNVAAEPLMSSAYTGVEGGLLIVTADDPGMWSSQNEQDNRIYGLHSYVPVFEPYDPGEAKELAKYCINYSAEVKHPVILRTTTRVSHTRGPVNLGPVKVGRSKGIFKRKDDYVLVPSIARKDRKLMLKRWRRICDDVNRNPFNRIEGEGRKLVVASGLSYAYVKEVVANLKLNLGVLKVASTYPIPSELLLNYVTSESVDEILVVEELEPVVEMQVKSILNDARINVHVTGKELTGYEYEMRYERVLRAINEFLRLGLNINDLSNPEKRDINLPPRPPTFCPGCPYRPFFYALRNYLRKYVKSYVVAGDIGCYALAHNPPFNLQDVVIEMGGSIGVANGLGVTTDSLIIAVIGDSTFFHAGMPPLANAAWHSIPILVIVLDNEVTAMTGHQPSPASRTEGRYVKIEDVAKGFGLEFVRVVDPFNIDEVMEALNSAVRYLKESGMPAVLIVRRRCALQAIRLMRASGITLPKITVNREACIGCGTCYNLFACPAITPSDSGKAVIDPSLCVGCGACVNVCPVKAIVPESGREPPIKGLIDKYWR